MLISIFNNMTSRDLLLCLVVIFLLIISILMVYLVYSLSSNYVEEDSENEMLELQELSKTLEQASKKPTTIHLTEFEQEQEDKAIISYDELLKNKDKVSIGYESTELKDDIEVKKIDLENTGTIELDPEKKEINSKTPLMSYEHEEEFLRTLKKLQYLLNK